VIEAQQWYEGQVDGLFTSRSLGLGVFRVARFEIRQRMTDSWNPEPLTDFRFNYPTDEGGSCHVDVRTTDSGTLAFGVLTVECGNDLSDKVADVVPFDQGDVNHSEHVIDFECEEPSKLADDLMYRLFFGDDNPPSQEARAELRDKLIDWIVENCKPAADAYFSGRDPAVGAFMDCACALLTLPLARYRGK
jgi:hypothetical protein